MPTNKRKDKRLQERLRAGDEAIAKFEKCERSLTAAARDHLATLDSLAAALARLGKFEVLGDEFHALQRKHGDLKSEFDSIVHENETLRTEISEARNLLLKLTAQNNSLRTEDRDSAKLRRRLHEKTTQLSQRNTEISQLKQQARGY